MPLEPVRRPDRALVVLAWLLLLAIWLVSREALAAHAATASFGRPRELTLSSDGRTLDLVSEGATRAEIVDRLALVTGAEVRGHPGSDPVWIALRGEPIERAIAHILRQQSYLLFFSPSAESTRLARIVVVSSADGSLPPSADASRARKPAVEQPRAGASGATTTRLEDVVDLVRHRDRAHAKALLGEILRRNVDRVVRLAAFGGLEEMGGLTPDLLREVIADESDLDLRLRALEHLETSSRRDASLASFLADLAATDPNPNVSELAGGILDAMSSATIQSDRGDL
jgi:hypothetical protein